MCANSICGRRASPRRSPGRSATVVKVVDASALAAVLFGEDEAFDISLLIHGARLIAPLLMPFELANICLKKCRRDPDRRSAYIDALAALGSREIEELPVDHDEVLALALETGLTAYDASYLWLARRQLYPLHTTAI